ncbi:hypothetical protein [Flavobacterium aquatile]|uniref:Uncharacterized protein n=1 Tax=Flavobacterium aquatile LMG 4008 = ATCC 11947 TaxID=1453498 RepID=A0A095SYJ8_9FLAO|nr:hypothetical protein [Flavobacterium aquatile]KGD69597.1 hypothetical protein LG45_02235 [Flavobacterium aquatile LMG 4008 = ATCC 11947]OXA67264.1 hypothetical protein B0A61_08645 [Flavobacterium aquatile LMG 4008 = ATCC 11947]GEC77923.1 hypothetical protein FAQ01_07930 [Flavobacterium aquatile]
MQKFTIGNQVIEYEIYRGIVLDNQAGLETSVRSHKDSHGYVTGISTHSTHHQKVYIQGADEKPIAIDLRNWDLPALTGHELIFIWAQSPHKQNYALAYNKTMDVLREVNEPEGYFSRPAGSAGCLVVVLGFIGALTLSYFCYDATKSESAGWVGFLIGIGVLGLLLFNVFSRLNTATRNGKKFKEKIIQIFNENRG